MKCPECGKDNNSKFKFCQFCGHSLEMPLDSDSFEIPSSTLSSPDTFDDWFVDGDKPHPSLFANAIDVDSAPSVSTAKGKAAPAKLPPKENQVRLSPKLALSKLGGKLETKPDAGKKKQIGINTQNSADDDQKTVSDSDAKSSHNSMTGRQLNLKSSDDANSVISLNERPESKPRLCLKCGTQLIEGHKFCGNCGQPAEITPDYDPVCDDGTNQDISDRVLMSSSNIQPSPRDSMSFGQMHVMPNETQRLAPFSLCHIRDDGSEGEKIQLFMGENIIGKCSSDALRNDQFVSPKHARIVCSDEKVIIEDFNSLNGVFFRISNESIVLYNNDIFRIGEELLLYAHGDSQQPVLSNPRGENSVLLGGEEPQGWGYLRTILGPFSEGNVYRLWHPTVTLGRTRANIIFPHDGFVSGTHASLKVQKDFAILTDLNSSNGTFIRLKDAMEVTEKAHILIGNQLIRICRK